MKKIYIAAYHQSKFGKLFDMTVPEVVANAVNETCAEIGAEPQTIDVASVGATCNFSLNQQGLLSGLVAMVPGLESVRPETVEYLKNWMMSPEHIAHPYPTEQEKAQIMQDTGIELKQLTNW